MGYSTQKERNEKQKQSIKQSKIEAKKIARKQKAERKRLHQVEMENELRNLEHQRIALQEQQNAEMRKSRLENLEAQKRQEALEKQRINEIKYGLKRVADKI